VLDWITRLSHQDGLTVVFTTHQPQHALAVADGVLPMLGDARFTCAPASEALSEENLRALYGVDLRRLVFEYHGRTVQTLVPVMDQRTAPRLASEQLSTERVKIGGSCDDIRLPDPGFGNDS
jgi:ABC-type sulfate/molybdate transport systems ATPase subunit